LKVADLKDLLKSRGLDTSGRSKEVLIQRLEEADQAKNINLESKRTLRDRSSVKKTKTFAQEEYEQPKKKAKGRGTKAVKENTETYTGALEIVDGKYDAFNTGIISTDLWVILLSYCDAKSMCRTSCTSKAIYKLSSANSIWRAQYAKIWTIGSGSDWKTNFTDPKFLIDEKTNTGWKARFIHRMGLKKKERDYEALEEMVGAIEYLQNLQGAIPSRETTPTTIRSWQIESWEKVPKLAVFTENKLGSGKMFTVIGPSTIPVMFQTVFRPHPGESVWFFRGSVYSFKLKNTIVIFEIQADFNCDEDLYHSSPLIETVTRLIYGIKTEEKLDYPHSGAVENLLLALSGADEESTHYNTGDMDVDNPPEDEIYS